MCVFLLRIDLRIGREEIGERERSQPLAAAAMATPGPAARVTGRDMTGAIAGMRGTMDGVITAQVVGLRVELQERVTRIVATLQSKIATLKVKLQTMRGYGEAQNLTQPDLGQRRVDDHKGSGVRGRR